MQSRNFESNATYTCNAGFTLAQGSGDVIRTCQASGEWSGSVPACEEEGKLNLIGWTNYQLSPS